MNKQEPRISASFVVDKDGRPSFVESGKRRHYKIEFAIESVPDDTYVATFTLDPTYYDPVRNVSADERGEFRLKTTSYGDYPFSVRLCRAGATDLFLRDTVARALERTSGNTAKSPEIADAIEYIAKN